MLLKQNKILLLFLICLPIVGFLMSCVTAMETELKRPERINATMCKYLEKKGGDNVPAEVTKKFIKGEGNKAILYLEYFDLTPSGKYSMKAVWYGPDGIWGSLVDTFRPKNPVFYNGFSYTWTLSTSYKAVYG